MVNSQIAQIDIKINPKLNCTKVNDEKINCQNSSSKTSIINRPKYVVTSCCNIYKRKAINSFLSRKYKKVINALNILNYHSKGSVNITYNSGLCHQLSYWKFGHKKTYIVKFDKKVYKNSIKNWQAGINLEGKKNNLYKIKKIKNESKFSFLKVILQEEKYKNIKVVTNFLGNKLANFKITGFGTYSLDGLNDGDWKLKKAFYFGEI